MRKIIFSILVVLVAVVMIWCIVLYASTPRLSRREKEEIENIYYESWKQISVPTVPSLVWYDENGHIEEENVFRYIGTYGDCFAFLVIGDNMNAIFENVDIPYSINGLSRTVYYPVEAEVALYHTKNEFTYDEIYNFEGVEGKYRLCYLAGIKNREEWLTNEQLERLTQDVEKIAEAHN